MYEKTYTVYVACDGKEFANEDDCLNYERQTHGKEVEGQIFFYDSNFSKLPLTALEEVVYAHILTEKAGLWFKNQNESLGYENPWEQKEDFPLTGIFFWEQDSWEWRELESEYEKLKIMLEKIKGAR